MKRSVILVVFATTMSQLLIPGPVKTFLPRLPGPPKSGSENNPGFGPNCSRGELVGASGIFAAPGLKFARCVLPVPSLSRSTKISNGLPAEKRRDSGQRPSFEHFANKPVAQMRFAATHWQLRCVIHHEAVPGIEARIAALLAQIERVRRENEIAQLGSQRIPGIIDRVRVCVSALEEQPVREPLGNGGLQAVVNRIGNALL